MSDAEGETKPDPKSSGGDIKDYVHKLADPALNYAAFKGHIDAVTKLLPKDETLFHYSPPLDKTTPLHYACLGGSMEVVKLLLEKMPAAVSARDSNRRSALHFAALGSNLDIVKLLLEKIPKAVIGEDSGGRYPLHYAALSGNTEIVDLLLPYLPRVVVRDGLRATPLHYAALGGNVECVRRLLKENMRIYETDSFGATPLHYAALGHNLQSLNVLNFSNETICTLKEFEESPLSLLAFKGVLSSGHPQDFWRHKENIFPWTSCKEHQMSELAHKWKGHYEVFELLLENGADVSLKDMCRGTLLHYAAYGGNPKIFDKALEQITNANQVDWWNRKPLVYAALGGNLEIFEQHFDDGTYKHELDKSSPGEWYCIGPQKFAKKYPDADGNLCSETDQTLLHYAAVGGNAKVFELSLRHVADVKSRDKNGSTPLHYAALGGNLKIVALLLDKGASVDIRNKDGRAPLHYAAVRGSQAVFDFFAARDLTASTLSDASGFTPDAYFKMRTQKDPIVDLSIHVLQTKRVEQMQEGQAKEKLSGAKTELETDLDEASSTLAARSGYSECSYSLATETTGAQLDERDDPISCLNKMSLHTSGEDPEEKGTKLMMKSHSEEWNPADRAEMRVLTVIENGDVSCKLREIDHPVLAHLVKEDIDSGRLILLPKTIYVEEFDCKKAKLPVEVRVNVKSILQQIDEASLTKGFFFILCKSNGKVTDITIDSQAQVQGEELVYLCHHFSGHLIGWTSFLKIIEYLRTLWSGIFLAYLCPSAKIEGTCLSLAILCHTPDAMECKPHQCNDMQTPQEIHCESGVQLNCKWFTVNGQEMKASSTVHPVRVNIWKTSGQLIFTKKYTESIHPSSLEMELSAVLNTGHVTIDTYGEIKVYAGTLETCRKLEYTEFLKDLIELISKMHKEHKVHCDIKPSNVMVKMVDQEGSHKPDLPYSKFSQELPEGMQTFAKKPNQPYQEDWMASEMMQPENSLTSLIDIFAAGKVIWYCITNAGQMEFLPDPYKESSYERACSNDLVQQMTKQEPSERPSADEVLKNPFFWNENEQLEFLKIVSENVNGDKQKNKDAALAVNDDAGYFKDWKNRLVDALDRDNYKDTANTDSKECPSTDDKNEITKGSNEKKSKAKFKTDLEKEHILKVDPSVTELLKLIRNKATHFEQFSSGSKAFFQNSPGGLLKYFTKLFPGLVLHIYKKFRGHHLGTGVKDYYYNTA